MPAFLFEQDLEIQMLTLINTNRMTPPIGPIGLDYVGGAARRAGIDVNILDLTLTDDPKKAITGHLSIRQSDLIGLSFRNADDCFWPSADWFVPELKDIVETIRNVTDTPIVVGGVGFSIFARQIFEYSGVDFGICGDGEAAIVSLFHQLRGKQEFREVPGLLWRQNGNIHTNPPSWPDPIQLETARDFIDNASYFKQGGQCGLETKRGCNRNCIYCADPLAKGCKPRLRNPSEIADEVQSLLSQGIDVLHICDSEFNIPRSHAYSVCEEFIRRSLGDRVRWYTYMSPTPFDADLAEAMAQSGCVGIDFTGDSGSETMLRAYRQQHHKEDLAEAVRLCRQNKISVMVDLLLGGPGETPQTARETIEFMKKIAPDCVGATLGMRLYPGTAVGKKVTEEFQAGEVSAIRRKYDGPLNLLQPTFYISKTLGLQPAKLVRDLIGGDERFFEPAVEIDHSVTPSDEAANYNYNENQQLVQAIRDGARGAYWDILRKLRKHR